MENQENITHYDNLKHTIHRERNSKNSACLIFSPPPQMTKSQAVRLEIDKVDDRREDLVLVCAKFQNALWLEFGSVKINTTTSISFKLDNPSKTKIVTIDVDYVNEKAGISVSLGDNHSNSIVIPPNESSFGIVQWNPTQSNATGIREVVKLKMDKKAPLQVTVHGTISLDKDQVNTASTVVSGSLKTAITKATSSKGGKQPLLTKRSLASSSLDSSISTAAITINNDKKMKSRDNLASTGKIYSSSNNKSSAINPSIPAYSTTTTTTTTTTGTSTIAKSDVDVWAEKQVNSFTDWINYTFAQAQVISKPSDSSNVQRDSDSCVNTMHDETDATAYGLNDLMQRRAEAKLRQEGVNLLHHSNLAAIIKSIEGEVVEGRLTVRSDRDVHADLGLQEGLFEILFCYEYQWLRLGLEVVFGQVISIPMSKASTTKIAAMKRRSTIPCVSGCSKWKVALKSFIQDYLLSDTDITTKQFDKQKLLYAAQERKMKELLRRHLLKKFFALVCFLDTARTTELMAKACLFQSTAEYKSSQEMIAAFCRLFLKGEGDITRHLMSIGCKLHFVQSYVDEFDYRLSSVTTELRDGVRLVKLMDLLTKSRDLCQQLRVPAVSRLQKLHNVSLVLNRLYRPTDPRPDAKQIVDGHRDMTLMLLWKILYTYELCNNTNPTRIYDEIAAIKRAASWRRSIYKMEESKTMAVKVSTLQGDATIINQSKLGKSNAKLSVNKHVLDSTADDISLAGALLQWCQAIVKRYDVPVNDLTTCMADGRALCLVVHYYHPAILPIRLIRKTSANINDEEDNESIGSSSSSSNSNNNNSSSSSTLSNELLLRGLQGERRNYWTLRKACNGIGGIPVVLPEFDSRNIPDEKSMIVFLGYLFSRLVESSCQVRAAIRIQRAIRLHLLKYELYTTSKELVMNDINPVEYSHEKTADDSVVLMKNVNKDEAILKRKEIIAFRKLQQVKVSIKMCSNQAATVIQRKMRSYVVRKKYLADRQSTDTGSSSSECIDNEQMIELMVDSEECNNDDIIEITRDEVFNIIDLTISSIAAKDLKEAKDRSLQSERRFSLLSELQSSFSSKCITKNFHNQVLQELETSRLYQAIVISSEDDKKHALANAVLAEEERIAREKAEFRVEEEMAMRVAMELRLIEMETLRQQEHEVALRADEEKKKREEELLIAQERLEAERLKRDEIERLREINEAESRRMLEEATDIERQARKVAEERMEKEIMARLALEARLNAIEEAAIAIEIERLRVIEEERLMAANRLDAAITLQFYWREYAAYMKKHKIFNGVSQLQARYRGHLVRKQMRCSQLAVSIIQALWRRKQCSKELQHRSLKTIQIQACWRGYAIRKTQKVASKASTSIARFWKTIQQRLRFVSIRKAVISIQSFLRRIVVQREYQTKRSSIIQLQSCFRKYQTMKSFALKVISALIIQKSWRRAMVLRACQAKHSDSRRQELLQKIRAKMLHRVLKTFVNRVLMKLRQKFAASKLVRWYLSRRPLMFVRKLLNGFRRLQAVYRACKVRSKSIKAVRIMRSTLKECEIKAKSNPNQCLGKRTLAALQVLQNGKMISHLLKACQTLELSTQLSRPCCESFAHAGAASILFTLLRSCNRSTPHQELLRIALIVLLNVGRHGHLAPILAASPDSTDALIDLMQMFRDKKSIFILTSELLARLISASEDTKITCNLSVYRKRLDGIVHIMERKHRLEARVRSVGELPLRSLASPIPLWPGNSYKSKGKTVVDPLLCMQHIMTLLG